MSAVAGRAGVQRSTLYRYFPDETALFGACSAHWLSQKPAARLGSLEVARSAAPAAASRRRSGTPSPSRPGSLVREQGLSNREALALAEALVASAADGGA